MKTRRSCSTGTRSACLVSRPKQLGFICRYWASWQRGRLSSEKLEAVPMIERIREKEREAASWLDIREVLTAPQSPWQNAYVERLIGSIRRCTLRFLPCDISSWFSSDPAVVIASVWRALIDCYGCGFRLFGQAGDPGSLSAHL